MRKIILLLAIAIVCHGEASAGPKMHKYRTDFDHYFKKYSKHYFGLDFDWRWFKAQAVAESNLNEKAESWVKAKGIMQLMPATFEEIQKRNPHFLDILEPRWNIAAGIYYDRQMWNRWEVVEPDTARLSFTFASYNAGAGTLLKAQATAKKKGLLETLWDSIVAVAPEVPRWRHKETLHYVEKIKVLVEEVDR
jgi:membrane-bound lytic murein transglycosylase F